MIESSVSQGFEEILKGSLAYLEYNPPGLSETDLLRTHSDAKLTRTSVRHQELTRLDVYSNLVRFAAGSSLVERKSADLKESSSSC